MVHIPQEFYRGKVEELDPGVRARLREDYEARVAARMERSNQLAPAEPTRSQDEKAVDTRSVAEIRRDAVQSWLRMRPKEAESSSEERAATDKSPERHEEHRSGPDRGREPRMDREPRADHESRPDRESDRDVVSVSPPALEDDADM
jgi:hypothetical protein